MRQVTVKAQSPVAKRNSRILLKGHKLVSRSKYSIDLANQIENLFKKDRKKFLGFIRQRVRSQEEAEDILQDVFTNVLAASRNVEKPSNAK